MALAHKYDIVIQKGAKYYEEFQFVTDAGLPVPFENVTLKGRVKESHKSSTVLHELTEANGGIIRLNNTLGKFALFIPSNATNVTADFGVYDVISIDNANPTTETDRLLEGTVKYTKNVTVQ